jgi:hypothetical protein
LYVFFFFGLFLSIDELDVEAESAIA